MPCGPEVTGGRPAGVDVTFEESKFGDRTFVRLVYEQPYGLDHDFDEQFKPVFGDRYEDDYCREKEPGPALGLLPHSYSALNHELLGARVTFEEARTQGNRL